MDFYDREGNPIELRDFVRLLSDESYRILDQDEVDGFQVCTIWLGLDHGWGRGPLQLFETMIYCDGWDGEYQARWPTELVAREAHMKIVDMIRRGLLLELGERIHAGTVLQHMR